MVEGIVFGLLIELFLFEGVKIICYKWLFGYELYIKYEWKIKVLC